MPFLYSLAIVGAVMDWRYVRAGGVRSSAAEKRNVGIAGLLVIGTALTMGFLGGQAGPIGDFVGLMIWLIFAFWEFRRWTVRRKYPRGTFPQP